MLCSLLQIEGSDLFHSGITGVLEGLKMASEQTCLILQLTNNTRLLDLTVFVPVCSQSRYPKYLFRAHLSTCCRDMHHGDRLLFFGAGGAKPSKRLER